MERAFSPASIGYNGFQEDGGRGKRNHISAFRTIYLY